MSGHSQPLPLQAADKTDSAVSDRHDGQEESQAERAIQVKERETADLNLNNYFAAGNLIVLR